MDFAAIDELKTKLKSMRPLNETEIKRLRKEFIIENTYNSNAIEGNTLTLKETALILQEGLTISEKPIKEHLEAVGHKDAFEYVITLADTFTDLTERVIKGIHSLVLMNDASSKGVYRRVPVTVMGAVNTPPQPYLVPVKMEELMRDYESIKRERHIIEAVAEFHLRFESIHPFIDGNGRTARLVMNLALLQAGYPIAVIPPMLRGDYIYLISLANKGDCEQFFNFISSVEYESAREYLRMVEHFCGG